SPRRDPTSGIYYSARPRSALAGDRVDDGGGQSTPSFVNRQPYDLTKVALFPASAVAHALLFYFGRRSTMAECARGEWTIVEVIQAMNVRLAVFLLAFAATLTDRKSTRLNSSHVSISYAVF